MTRWTSPAIRAALALGGLAAGFGTAAAQTDSRLVAVVKLAQDGMADSARGELQRLMNGLTPTDSLYPEALYTQALVAVTDSERRLALRKVMVEYSASGWADDAILLLGQIEYASGNPSATVTQITKLLNDYPMSPLRATAAFWGARAAADLGNGQLACQWADLGLATTSNDVELKNRLDYQKQRCEGIMTLQADSAQRAQPPPQPGPPSRAGAGRAPGYYVQIIAAPTREVAVREEDRLKRLNYDTAIIAEGGYFKVRAGPFSNRAEAERALARIGRALGVKPFIVSVR